MMPKSRNEYFSDPIWPLQVSPSLKDISLSQSLNFHIKDSTNKQANRDSTDQKYNLQQDLKRSSMMSESTQKCNPAQNCGLAMEQLMKYHQMQQEIINSEQIDEDYQVKIQYLSQPQSEQSQSSSLNTANITRYITKQQCKGKYQILNKKIKKYLVKQSEKSSAAAVAKKYGISVNNLCRWKRSCQRRRGAGRKVNDMELENRLIEWIQSQKKKPIITLTRRVIQEKARLWSNDKLFKASKGWLERFSARNRQLGLLELFGFKGTNFKNLAWHGSLIEQKV